MNTDANSDEILNLDYNFSKLVCRALNITKGNHRAARAFWAVFEGVEKSVDKNTPEEIGSMVN